VVTRAPDAPVVERIVRDAGPLLGGASRYVTPAPPHARPAQRDGLART
jgi:hypothetical protein